MWAVAADDAAETIASGEADVVTLWLDGIAEIDLMALGAVLDVAYEPALVADIEDGGFVLRVPHVFLRALAALREDSCAGVATRWRAAAEGLASQGLDDLAATLSQMTTFARAALAGLGALSVPMM